MPRPKRKNSFNTVSEAADESATFEKFSYTPSVPMPAATFRQPIRAVNKTRGSKRASLQFTATVGGMHRRRNKRGF